MKPQDIMRSILNVLKELRNPTPSRCQVYSIEQCIILLYDFLSYCLRFISTASIIVLVVNMLFSFLFSSLSTYSHCYKVARHFTPIFSIFLPFTAMLLSSSLHDQIYIWNIILLSISIFLPMFYLFYIEAYTSHFFIISNYNEICFNLSLELFLLSKTALQYYC